MKKYKVNAEHKGVVMIGETPYRAGQTIVDNDSSPRTTSTIEKLLALKKSPIKVVEDDNPAENKLIEQQQGKEAEREVSSSAEQSEVETKKKGGAK